MIKRQFGFTLIEILVVVVTIGLLMVAAGGIMVSSFKAKGDSENFGKLQNEAVAVFAELRKNVLEAQGETIVCPPSGIGSSVSFMTVNGGETRLICDDLLSQISSESATSGSFRLNSADVQIGNCPSFVRCNYSGSEVKELVFSIDVGITGGEDGGMVENFDSVVSPRR